MERFKIVMVFVAALAVTIASVGAITRTEGADRAPPKKKPRIVYPKKTELDFEGINIEGEIKDPAELYFQRRPEEKFDSLVKRRKNFHQEMLRDVVLSK